MPPNIRFLFAEHHAVSERTLTKSVLLVILFFKVTSIIVENINTCFKGQPAKGHFPSTEEENSAIVGRLEERMRKGNLIEITVDNRDSCRVPDTRF